MHIVCSATKTPFSLNFVRTSTKLTGEANNLSTDLESNLASSRREASFFFFFFLFFVGLAMMKVFTKDFQHYSCTPKPLLCPICTSQPAS